MVFVQKGYFWPSLGNLSQFVCFSFSLPPVEILCVCVCVCVGECACVRRESTYICGNVLNLPYVEQKLSLSEENKD